MASHCPPPPFCFQAHWRGYWTRQQLRRALDRAKFVDDDDFDYAEVDFAKLVNIDEAKIAALEADFCRPPSRPTAAAPPPKAADPAAVPPRSSPRPPSGPPVRTRAAWFVGGGRDSTQDVTRDAHPFFPFQGIVTGR